MNLCQTKSRLALFLAFLLIGSTVNGSVIGVPVGEPVFDLEYDWTYRHFIQSGDLRSLSPTGPFRFDRFKNEGRTGLALVSDPTENHLRLIGSTNGRAYFADGGGSNQYYTFTGGIRYTVSESFGLLGRFEFDRERALDSAYTGETWRGMSGAVITAAIYYTKPSISIVLGRERVFWGPQPVNLALSATSEPLDLISLKYHKGRLDFSFLMARLDRSRPDSLDYIRFPDLDPNENRFLAGHRLDLRLWNNLRLGLFELTLFGGTGRTPELYYLNPLQSFHAVQLNEQIDDNTALGFDLTWIPKAGYFMYGQMLIDDYQIDNEAQGDQEPNEIGLMTGLVKTGQTASLNPDIKIEYTRLTNRTYHQRRPRNRFLHGNRLLGHPLGPDADSLALTLSWWPSARQVITLEGALRRHGEGSIYNSWDEPWALVTGEYSEPFPTGVVESASFIKVGMRGYPPFDGFLGENLFFDLSLIHGQYRNFGNVEGLSKSRTWVGLSLTWLGGGSFDLSD